MALRENSVDVKNELEALSQVEVLCSDVWQKIAMLAFDFEKV